MSKAGLKIKTWHKIAVSIFQTSSVTFSTRDGNWVSLSEGSVEFLAAEDNAFSQPCGVTPLHRATNVSLVVK